jgi:hypothetical protein
VTIFRFIVRIAVHGKRKGTLAAVNDATLACFHHLHCELRQLLREQKVPKAFIARVTDEHKQLMFHHASIVNA